MAKRKSPLARAEMRAAIEPKTPPKTAADKDYGGGWKSPWTRGNMEVRRLKDMTKG